MLSAVHRAFGQAKKTPIVIGWLQFNAMESPEAAEALAAFKEGFAALGWKEGVQYVLVIRSADGKPERLNDMAKQLAALRPALLIGTSGLTATALSRAAPDIPIVQTSGSTPGPKRAKSLARPGGMTTGITSLPGEVSEKLLEFLVAIEPKLQRVGFLVPFSPNMAPSSRGVTAARRSAERLKVEAHIEHPTSPEAIERAVERFATRGVQALIVMASPFLIVERPRIIRLAQAQRWPLVAQGARWVDEGALLSYAANIRENHRRAAYYVDRILKGAKPGDLPIEQARDFELVLNLKVAKALGLAIPQAVLVQANRVIE